MVWTGCTVCWQQILGTASRWRHARAGGLARSPGRRIFCMAWCSRLLLYAVGAADGLTERAIRRSCGGRESASLYHRAKYLQMVALGLGGVALLVWPGPVAWELCAGLIVILTAWLARQQWAFYKKHL